jgi:hypothetical protein
MTRRLLFLLGSTVLVVAALVLVGNSVNSVTAPPWGSTTGTERSAEITGDTVVGQRFVASFPGLHRIDVGLDPAQVRGGHHLTFHLKKVDSPSTEDLWTTDLVSDDIRNGESHTFQFPPIRDSARQGYYFYLESDDSSPGDVVTIRYDPASFLVGSTALVDGQPVHGNLQFETFYALRTGDKVEILLSRMTEGRPYLFADRWFHIGLAVVYVVLLVVFLWQTAQAIGEQESA